MNEDTRKPYWVRLPRIDLRDCVIFVSRSCARDEEARETDGELAAILEEQHNQDFKGKSLVGELPTPFWRVVVVLGEEDKISSSLQICFIFHHALADTISGLAFHRSLLSALLRQEKVGTVDDEVAHEINMVQTPDLPLLPPLEDLHPLPLSFRCIWNEAKATLFPESTSGLWAGAPVPAVVIPNNYKTRFQFFTVAQTTTSRFVAICRANDATVTSTLQLLIADALFAQIPSYLTTLNVESAISFRRFLDPEMINDDSMGCFVSRYLYSHQRKSDSAEPIDHFTWGESRRIRKTIEAELEKDGRDNIIGMSRFIFSHNHFFKSMAGKPRETSFELSNVGIFKAREKEKESDWGIGRIVFSQSADITGAAFEISVVTGNDESLSIGFSWFSEIVEDGVIEKMIMLLKEMIRRITGE